MSLPKKQRKSSGSKKSRMKKTRKTKRTIPWQEVVGSMTVHKITSDDDSHYVTGDGRRVHFETYDDDARRNISEKAYAIREMPKGFRYLGEDPSVGQKHGRLEQYLQNKKTGAVFLWKPPSYLGKQKIGESLWEIYSKEKWDKTGIRAQVTKLPPTVKSIKYRENDFQWYAFSNLKGRWYEVHGGIGNMPLLRTTSKAEAIKFWRSMGDGAYYIQKYHGSWTDGTVSIYREKIRHKGKNYTRAYQGPHTKEEAESLAKSLTKDGLDSIARPMGKGGYGVFVEWRD